MIRPVVLALATIAAGINPANAQLPPAAQLVDLVQPHEREAAAARFMMRVSPIPARPTAPACAYTAVKGGTRAYFVQLYQSSLSADELAAAIAFFSSAEGKAAVRLRLAHEASAMDAAAAGKDGVSDTPTYPAPVQAAIDRFAQTPAGRKFFVDDLEATKVVRAAVDSIRSPLVVGCLTAGGGARR